MMLERPLSQDRSLFLGCLGSFSIEGNDDSAEASTWQLLNNNTQIIWTHNIYSTYSNHIIISKKVDRQFQPDPLLPKKMIRLQYDEVYQKLSRHILVLSTGAESLKKPHHIVTISFRQGVKGQAIYLFPFARLLLGSL